MSWWNLPRAFLQALHIGRRVPDVADKSQRPAGSARTGRRLPDFAEQGQTHRASAQADSTLDGLFSDAPTPLKGMATPGQVSTRVIHDRSALWNAASGHLLEQVTSGFCPGTEHRVTAVLRRVPALRQAVERRMLEELHNDTHVMTMARLLADLPESTGPVAEVSARFGYLRKDKDLQRRLEVSQTLEFLPTPGGLAMQLELGTTVEERRDAAERLRDFLPDERAWHALLGAVELEATARGQGDDPATFQALRSLRGWAPARPALENLLAKAEAAPLKAGLLLALYEGSGKAPASDWRHQLTAALPGLRSGAPKALVYEALGLFSEAAPGLRDSLDRHPREGPEATAILTALARHAREPEKLEFLRSFLGPTTLGAEAALLLLEHFLDTANTQTSLYADR